MCDVVMGPQIQGFLHHEFSSVCIDSLGQKQCDGDTVPWPNPHVQDIALSEDLLDFTLGESLEEKLAPWERHKTFCSEISFLYFYEDKNMENVKACNLSNICLTS